MSELKIAPRILRVPAEVKPPQGAVLKRLNEPQRNLLERRLSEPAECLVHPEFQESSCDWSMTSESGGNDDSGIRALGEPPCSASIESEHRIFMSFNYARYRVLKIMQDHAGQALTAASASELIHWESRVNALRARIVRDNMPLVMAMVRRVRSHSIDHAELISDGNLALIRAVDKFDCSRGFRFSTYACRAILKSFARVAAKTSRHRGHFPTEFDPTMEKSNSLATRRQGLEDSCSGELRVIIGQNLANLTEVERSVIRARFALDVSSEADEQAAQTLEQVGEMIGVTKERVRQIQNKALAKLKDYLESHVLA